MLAPLTLFIVVGFMSLKVALILLLCVPLIPVSIVVVQKIAKRLLAKYWNSYTGLADSFLENLQGLTTLKYYQSDLYYQDKMDREAEDFRKKTMRVLIMQLNSISVMDLVAYGGFGLGVVLGLQEYLDQHITFMMFVFIVMISIEFFLPLRMLGSYFHIGQNGNAAADKIFKLLDSLDDIQESYQESISTLSFEHVTFGYDEKIILKEKPDSVLPTLGGQAGLNLGMELAESGFLEKNGVRLIGTTATTIKRAEDRLEFKLTMEKINEPVAPSLVVENVEDGIEFTNKIGYPVVLRPAYTLGGSGGGIAHNLQELTLSLIHI